MRIGFLVNEVTTEKETYTTVRLGMTATARGHEAWFMGLADLAYDPDGSVHARACRVSRRQQYKSAAVYLEHLRGPKAHRERVEVTGLDALLLRSDPAGEGGRPWAPPAGLLFAQLAAQHGVIVLNDPYGLARAQNKMYFQGFPEEVRPRTLITRDKEEIRAFAREQGDTIVLKPLQGSGGQGVFLVRPSELGNINQMVEAISRDGYIIAQEYLPAAAEGDIRLFVMNGMPLREKGKYAAFRRTRAADDIRSNVHAGGTVCAANIGDTELRIVEIVRPKLVEDGMFLVGLDIVGDKLMEINVFSPGGLGNAQKFEGPNFARTVVEAIERKVEYSGYYGRNFNNTDMATL
ncbi:MAG: glutathione synthase [Planctomycetes bacterium]|nr:glutathione synthase [Planctomycetota bacterium]